MKLVLRKIRSPWFLALVLWLQPHTEGHCIKAALSCEALMQMFGHIAPFSTKDFQLYIHENAPEIKWSKLEQLKSVNPTPGDGAQNTFFEANYKGQDVFVKLVGTRTNQRSSSFADQSARRWFFNKQLYFHLELAKRGLTVPVLAITRDKKSYGIVSKFQRTGTFIKLRVYRHISDRAASDAAAAVRDCPSCRTQWIRNIQQIADFFRMNQLHVSVPQFILLPNGEVYLYDFALYNIVEDPREIENSQVAIARFVTLLESYSE